MLIFFLEKNQKYITMNTLQWLLLRVQLRWSCAKVALMRQCFLWVPWTRSSDVEKRSFNFFVGWGGGISTVLPDWWDQWLSGEQQRLQYHHSRFRKTRDTQESNQQNFFLRVIDFFLRVSQNWKKTYKCIEELNRKNVTNLFTRVSRRDVLVTWCTRNKYQKMFSVIDDFFAFSALLTSL